MPNPNPKNVETPFDLRLLYYLKACYESDTPTPEQKKIHEKGEDSNEDF